MSAADTVARMLALVPWLLERPGASVHEAADAFGVPPRTILEDLDTIGYCGLPGLGGGDLFEINLHRDRIVVRMAHELDEPLRLTPREGLRLVLAGEAVAAAMPEDVPALRSALDAVREAMGIPAAVEHDDEGSVWMQQIRTAIDDGQQVEISYRARGADAPVERVVHPWLLQLAEGEWYLRALDERSGEPRTFRLDRIADLQILDERAEPRPEDDLDVTPRYEPGPDDVEVELLLGPSVRWVAEEVRADVVTDEDDGSRRLVFHTDSLGWVTRLLLAAGPGAQVIRPPELADQVSRAASDALARYSASEG